MPRSEPPDWGSGGKVVKVDRVEWIAMPDVQKLLQLEGGTVSPSTPEEFAGFLRAEVDRWAKMVKETGITVD